MWGVVFTACLVIFISLFHIKEGVQLIEGGRGLHLCLCNGCSNVQVSSNVQVTGAKLRSSSFSRKKNVSAIKEGVCYKDVSRICRQGDVQPWG